jgi:aspartate aminotransferase
MSSPNNISKKAKQFKRNISPVREIMNYANPDYIRKLGINPEDLISFAGGWVNHKAPEKLREAYESIVSDPRLFHLTGGYSPTLGETEFKKAVCKFENELYGMDISEKQIVVGLGSTQLVMELFTVLLDPGDKILLLDPSYCNYPPQIITEIPDVEILRFSVINEKKWEFVADDKISEFTEYILDKKPKVVLLVSPDNPTSKVLSDEFVQATLDSVKKIGGYLIIDFAYKELVFNNEYPSYFSWSPNENFISLRSNSKWCRGLGRRLGWVEAPEFLVKYMESIQTSSVLCPDTMHQMALTKFINDSIESNTLIDYVKKTTELYKNAAEKTVEILEKKIGYNIIMPDGGLYIFMKVDMDGSKFVEDALKKTGVLFIPGRGFGRTGINAIRLSFGPLVEDIDKIEEGIEKVAIHLKSE